MKKPSEYVILVVDDEEDVRRYLQMALEDADFNVLTANDGLEALETVKQQKPDLISLDLVMPKHSGVKFFRELQKNKEWSKIPVLTVTGHARDDLGKADFDEMTMAGPGVYLEKPVKPDSYVRAVKKMLKIESEEKEKDVGEMKEEMKKMLESADADTLKKAMELLKNSK